jgi:5-methylthioribose kinase
LNNMYFSDVNVEGIEWINDSFKGWHSPSLAIILNRWVVFEEGSWFEWILKSIGARSLVDLREVNEELRVEAGLFLETIFEERLPVAGEQTVRGPIALMNTDEIEALMGADLRLEDAKDNLIEKRLPVAGAAERTVRGPLALMNTDEIEALMGADLQLKEAEDNLAGGEEVEWELHDMGDDLKRGAEE